MKKWVVYILLSSFILTNTDLIQIFRIPNLYSHFIEHSKHEKLTFKFYLKDHYINKSHTDHDTDQDNSLPFKSVITSILYIYNLNIPPVITRLNFNVFLIKTSAKVSNLRALHYVSSYLSTCWNPPKL
jgi:hypothetical protein